MDIEALVMLNNQRHTDYCGTCGGSGRTRAGLTGNEKLDFETCHTCRGTGRPKQFRSKRIQNMFEL
jgi:DnaJ-class molecular chaperone